MQASFLLDTPLNFFRLSCSNCEKIDHNFGKGLARTAYLSV
jgi:hypothetical protein